jgi:hypothetical protein
MKTAYVVKWEMWRYGSEEEETYDEYISSAMSLHSSREDADYQSRDVSVHFLCSDQYIFGNVIGDVEISNKLHDYISKNGYIQIDDGYLDDMSDVDDLIRRCKNEMEYQFNKKRERKRNKK